ncbi:MAG: type II restriction endonuclease [Desulfobacteraceae bacterium]
MTVMKKFKKLSLTRFLEEIEQNRLSWIVKRLSGNDTGLTGSHQAGIYFPRVFFEKATPEICKTECYNPEVFIDECFFPAQDDSIYGLRAIYYNSKYFPEKGLKKPYDEFRLTKWGGSSSPVQDKENTGSIFIFGVGRECGKLFSVAWVASTLEEEQLIENWLGSEVEPGRFILSDHKFESGNEIELPEHWLEKFPTGKEIFNFIVEKLPHKKWKHSIDKLLLKRRELEFEVFEKIEQEEVLPKIRDGFTSVEAFIKYAHSVSNRRKARTGASLELNLESIFIDEDVEFETQVKTENRKKPDFIFPSGSAYHDRKFPSSKLHMMAAKTCCKDRWRQIINEADRINIKHLFTLQQGVSAYQLEEMKDNNVQLIVPEPYLKSFPKEWRASIFTLEKFTAYIKKEQSQLTGLS